mmetsp:Transcript_26903/g.80651  ORF Transcript_26903/g.80651 Transcript_26903/m.80651 type:complete len:95 (+) Transcript_26903:658-942(+)
MAWSTEKPHKKAATNAVVSREPLMAGSRRAAGAGAGAAATAAVAPALAARRLERRVVGCSGSACALLAAAVACVRVQRFRCCALLAAAGARACD